MGVDTEIYLPPDVNDMALSRALGIFAGLRHELVKKDGGSSGSYLVCSVYGVETKATMMPTMGEIVLKAEARKRLVDGDSHHSVFFHIGSRFRKQIWISLRPRSTPFWIAVGKRLVDWFGGVLIYNDCADDTDPSNLYEGKRNHPVDENGWVPEDADPWREYQEAVSKLTAVTDKELREAWKKASYKDSFPRSGKVPKEERA